MVANVPKDINAGTSGAIISIGNELEKMGNIVRYIFSDDMPIQTKRPAWSYLYFAPISLLKILRDRIYGTKYDIMMFSGGEGYLIPILRWLILYPFVFVNHSHGQQFGRKGNSISKTSIKGFFAHRIVRRMQCIIATKYADITFTSTIMEKNMIIKDYNLREDSVSIAPLGLSDLMLFSTIKRNNFDYPLPSILFIGNWNHNKGKDIIKGVFTALSNQYSNMKMSIVSSENKSIVEEEISNISSLKIYESMDQGQLIKIYDSHDIFVLPTYSEGFGRVVVEAMSRGLCVITTPTGFASDGIKNGENGYIVPFGDTDSIVNLVNDLISDPGKIKEIGANARKSVEHMTWNNTAKIMIDSCRKIMNRTK